jgi:HK97 family phage prohead protease
MPKMMIDIGDFRPAHFPDKTKAPAVRAATVGDVVATAEDRTFTFVFSDESVDRYGDVIFARGWDLANFNANPIALAVHDSSAIGSVVGKAKNVRVEGSRLIGDIEFMSGEINPLAETVYQMVKGGFLKTVSVGFQPIEWELAKDKARPQGVNFKKQELLEISIVPIPANANALVQAKAAGIAIERLGLKIEATEAPAPAAVNYRALAKSYRKRGLYELASLCDLLNYADYVCRCVEQEAIDEGDNSPVPARMRAWIDEGNKIIAVMAAEETSENIQGAQDPAATEDQMERAVSRALEAAGLIKSGKAISAANEKRLRAAHEHLTAATECVMAVVEPADDGHDPEPDDDEARALRARKAAARARQQVFINEAM